MISGPLKWHGGKAYLAARVVALMPPHVHYVEPFFGGGSVLLAKDPEGVSEVVNDLNKELINFWRVLANEELFENFSRIAQAVPFSKAHWEEAGRMLKHLRRDDDFNHVPRAMAFFVRCRQSLAGRMDSFAPLSRNRVRRGMNEQASAWLNAVEGLPAVHDRLKRVVILGPEDALEIIRQQDGPRTLFYLDPPYLHETRATTGEYAHEMTGAQHEELLAALATLKGKFLLSGYANEMYRSHQARFGWNLHAFKLPNNAAGGSEKRRMTECVWCNF